MQPLMNIAADALDALLAGRRRTCTQVSSGKTEQVHFRATDAERRQIVDLAAARRMTVSRLLLELAARETRRLTMTPPRPR